VVHLATAPKSNSVTTALGAAMADVRAGRGGPVPAHLRDAHYPGSKGLGHGRGYQYPHDDPRGVVTQQYVPDDLVGSDYYEPGPHGAERAVQERVPRLRRVVRGLAGPPQPAQPASSGPPAVDLAAEPGARSTSSTDPRAAAQGGEISPSSPPSSSTGGIEAVEAAEGEDAGAVRNWGGASGGGADRAAGGAASADASQSSADIVDDGEPARATGAKKKASSGRGRRKPVTVAAKENRADDGGETAGEEQS